MNVSEAESCLICMCVCDFNGRRFDEVEILEVKLIDLMKQHLDLVDWNKERDQEKVCSRCILKLSNIHHLKQTCARNRFHLDGNLSSTPSPQSSRSLANHNESHYIEGIDIGRSITASSSEYEAIKARDTSSSNVSLFDFNCWEKLRIIKILNRLLLLPMQFNNMKVQILLNVLFVMLFILREDLDVIFQSNMNICDRLPS